MKLGRKNDNSEELSFFERSGISSDDGAATQIRTGDLILTKDALYLLSYSSKVHAPWGRGMMLWRPRRDLNPRPPA